MRVLAPHVCPTVRLSLPSLVTLTPGHGDGQTAAPYGDQIRLRRATDGGGSFRQRPAPFGAERPSLSPSSTRPALARASRVAGHRGTRPVLGRRVPGLRFHPQGVLRPRPDGAGGLRRAARRLRPKRVASTIRGFHPAQWDAEEVAVSQVPCDSRRRESFREAPSARGDPRSDFPTPPNVNALLGRPVFGGTGRTHQRHGIVARGLSVPFLDTCRPLDRGRILAWSFSPAHYPYRVPLARRSEALPLGAPCGTPVG